MDGATTSPLSRTLAAVLTARVDGAARLGLLETLTRTAESDPAAA